MTEGYTYEGLHDDCPVEVPHSHPGRAVQTINRPIRFDGTPEQKEANYRTHDFHTSGDPEDGDVRCWSCDCKPWHAAASYPCGVEPPRETVEVGG